MRFHAVTGDRPALVHNHEPCPDSLCTKVDELYVHGFTSFDVLSRVSDELVKENHGISYGPTEEMPMPPPGYRFLTREERVMANSGLNSAVKKYNYPIEKYL